jgi:uncharacterized membrane protein YkoI
MKVAASLAVIAVSIAWAIPAGAQEATVKVKEEKPGLLARAAIKPDSAQRIALSRVRGGEVVEIELEEEDGRLIYEIDIKTPGRDGTQEIKVDAGSGTVAGLYHAHDSLRVGAGVVKEDEPGLLARATVRPDSAAAIALKQVPGGTIIAREIEMEDGKLVYTFEIGLEGTRGVKEVIIDAKTGAVIEVKDE